MKRKSMKAEIAALTEEVRGLRAEVAALRLCQPVQFVPYVPVPVYPPQPMVAPLPIGPWWEPTTPIFTITCETVPS